MVKPNEVLVQTDPETGEVEEEVLEDVETVALYEKLRETLVQLTHIAPDEMSKVIN